MKDAVNYADLKQKQRAIRGGFPEPLGLRVHRAISWIGRAEMAGQDDDARFIFLWIAFNAAYANERDFQVAVQSEREVFLEYFRKLVSLDADRRIDSAIWQRFSGPVRLLMGSRYLYNSFWQHHNGIEGFSDWEARFKASHSAFLHAFRAGDTARVLSFLFNRLYVLRNQVVHGGSTWNSSVNRSQLRDGTAILGFLLPVFVNLMMDNPQADWGRPFYPVVA